MPLGNNPKYQHSLSLSDNSFFFFLITSITSKATELIFLGMFHRSFNFSVSEIVNLDINKLSGELRNIYKQISSCIIWMTENFLHTVFLNSHQYINKT